MSRPASMTGTRRRLAPKHKAARALVLAELTGSNAPIGQSVADALANEAKHRSRKGRR
jgi:hypothetical protein